MKTIERELLKDKKKRESLMSADAAIQQFKLITNGDVQRDNSLLMKMSPNGQLVHKNDEFGGLVTLERHEKIYPGQIYTLAQIKRFAIKYNLRFLNSTLYTKGFDSLTALKIREFAETANNNIVADESGKKRLAVDLEGDLQTHFFMLAPEECFTLKIKKVEYTHYEFKLDPAVFYRIDDNHYALIHLFGKDFTPFRLLQGFKMQSYGCNLVYNTAKYLPFVAIIAAIVLNLSFMFTYPIIAVCCILGISALLAVIRSIEYLKDGNVISGFFGETAWNSAEKIERS